MTHRSSNQVLAELKSKLVGLTGQVHGLLLQMRDEVIAESSSTPGGRRGRSLDQFKEFVGTLYDSADLPVLGMGFLPVPDDSARIRPQWWYQQPDAAKNKVGMKPLSVAPEPEALDFYDIVATEWWRNAVESNRPVASGPFVDISGTNAYVLTFAQSVRIDGELIGVVAVDVTVSTFQSLCQNDLLDLPRGTSVVNPEGMVLATNIGALLGGVVDMNTVPASRKKPITRTSWVVVTT
ncbi:hypothetical protein GIY30_19095 [Gordonia sp. HNM0687]|uniref:Cache domain-containing protein n=1 Tax=Gordonia mangrovi TaxID=2665643 RepID=A0A6L7GTW1_9ACTN|nr:cache domain-containing protein [Gordonia mangrovi]MXP23449.1 hypothetical protein [Gordonia mangrovi]UVF76655.1 cache domain-containing protein [Gordonia mangrovi]